MKGPAQHLVTDAALGGPPEHDLVHFSKIAEIARQDAGLVLPSDKAPMVMARVGKRLRTIGTPSLAEYCALVSGANGAQERRELIYVLTTNVTSFMREAHHFEVLRNQILPRLVERARKGTKIRFWSAGCSTGQEPYSIAMVVLDMFPEAADHDIRVLATDIDRHVLGTARRGVYQEQQIEALPAGFRQSFLEPQPGSGPGRNFGVVPKVKDLVAFRELNLLGPWPMSGQFQAIFCRNVVIYFDRETQARLWSRFSDALTADGHLFLGHSERVEPDGHHDLRAVGTTLYQKVDPASAGPERN